MHPRSAPAAPRRAKNQFAGSEAGAKVFQGLDCLKTLPGVRRQRSSRRGDQVCECLVVGTPDPATQLVQLCKSESVCSIDQNRIRVRYIEATLDYRGANKDMETSMIEVEHDLFEIALAHLAVGYLNARSG
jgi:hypothetical protein